MCVKTAENDFKNCEKDIGKINEFMKDLKVTVVATYDQMDFKNRVTMPTSSLVEYLGTFQLDPHNQQFVNIFLRQNFFQTFDNMFKSFFPSFEGTFFDIKKISLSSDQISPQQTTAFTISLYHGDTFQ